MVKSSSLLGRTRFYARKAFTMIELIFAIVVLAVVMLTIPMMIQANNKALEGNVAQEAIFLVSALLSETTTFIWDAASVDNSGGSILMTKILDTAGTGDSAYDRNETNGTIRVGGISEDMHRRFFDINSSGAGVSPDGTAISVTLDSPSSELTGYKLDFNVSASRYYVNDTAPTVSSGVATFDFNITATTGPTNIKLTEVVIQAPENEGGTPVDIARLRAYTTNIGEIDYAKRRF